MDKKIMDRIQALEKRREAGESVPELDRLYQMVDQQQQAGYKAATEPMKPASAASMPVRKAGGGMTASKRADGIAVKGKTRGKMV